MQNNLPRKRLSGLKSKDDDNVVFLEVMEFTEE
jgi:hypothetical protein